MADDLLRVLCGRRDGPIGPGKTVGVFLRERYLREESSLLQCKLPAIQPSGQEHRRPDDPRFARRGGNLAWASFPCQDLSPAGNGAGLDGDRSGTFWAFWNLIRDLQRVNRAPRLIVLENVTGAITSNKGEDFRTLLRALASAGYRFGPLVIDGIHFVPQSRPRLFIVATDVHIPFPQEQRRASPSDLWHSPALRAAHENLSADLKAKWLWLDLPAPPRRQLNLSSLLEPDAKVEWHSRHKTNFLLSIMSEVNLCKVREAQNLGCRIVGTL